MYVKIGLSFEEFGDWGFAHEIINGLSRHGFDLRNFGSRVAWGG